MIVGDSIISKLESWRMSNKSNKIAVKDFPGATVDDMQDYIKPLIRRYKPNRVILHVGTNNLKHDQPQSIVDKINSVVNYIQDNSNCAVVISELTPKADSLESRRKEINRLLNQSFQHVITHTNIDQHQINSEDFI